MKPNSLITTPWKRGLPVLVGCLVLCLAWLFAECFRVLGPLSFTNFANYTSRKVEPRASAATPSVLLLNDKFDPGWEVWVDGQSAKLLRCNFLMRGVQVPAGEHTIAFQFRPRRVALYVSFGAFGVGLLLLGWLLLMTRRASAPEISNFADTATPCPRKPTVSIASPETLSRPRGVAARPVTNLDAGRRKKPNSTSQPLLQTGAAVTSKRASGLAHHSKISRSISLILSSLTLAAATHAQQFSIDWFTIDGGGGTSTGGVYSVSGTIGQPDAGILMRGGNFRLTGGFWSLSAVQAPGAPLLTIFLTGTNTAVVSWPSPSTGFNLQQNTDLNPTYWSAALETVADNGTNKFIVVNPPVGNRFYRLSKP